MITCLIKVILCSGLFIVVHKLLLEKENMHRFNRFYLLASLALSFVIPFVTFNFNATSLPVAEDVIQFMPIVQQADTGIQQPVTASYNSYWPLLLLTIYCLVTVMLLLRFIKNVMTVLDKIRRCQVITYGAARLVLTYENIAPHSFLHYIFINRAAYESGLIRQEILLHEVLHVKQRHSCDVLFVEALQVIFWFNPFVYFYRRALMINHEFLADEAVIKTCPDVSAYQHLLIDNAGKQASPVIASRFNYLIIKKRLLMMTKTKSFKNALYRQLAVVPFLAIALFFFSSKIVAQQATDSVKVGITKVPSTKEGITQEQLDEYQAIINKYKTEDGKANYNKITGEDKEKLTELFLQMSKEQQAKQTVIFMLAPPPFQKEVPSAAQFQSFKNANVYGVWVDGKRVANSTLNNYTNTDFSHVFISKLYGAAKKGRNYTHQVDLMTTAYYKDYYQNAIAKKDKYFLAVRWSSKKKS